MSLINLFSKKDGKARRRELSLSPITSPRSEEYGRRVVSENVDDPIASCPYGKFMPLYDSGKTQVWGAPELLGGSEESIKEMRRRYAIAALQGPNVPKTTSEIVRGIDEMRRYIGREMAIRAMQQTNVIVTNNKTEANMQLKRAEQFEAVEAHKRASSWMTPGLNANFNSEQLTSPSMPYNGTSLNTNFLQNILQTWNNIPAQTNSSHNFNASMNPNYAMNAQQINSAPGMQHTNFQNTPYLS